MSTDQTTNLGLPFLMPAQAQKHVTVNEGLNRLDTLCQLAVESRSVSLQPGSPADGAAWITPPGKTGSEWGGYADWSLAAYRDGAWEALAPKAGWRAYVKDEGTLVTWTGAAWVALAPAESFRNALINGCFRIWARGSVNGCIFSDADGYTADRWLTNRAGGASGLTVSRQPGPIGFHYAMRLQRDGGDAATAALNALYTLETADAVAFQGRRATLSFRARCGGDYSPSAAGLSVAIRYGAGEDERVDAFTGSTDAASATLALSTSWQTFTLTTPSALPSTATGLGLAFSASPAGTAGADDWLELAGVQLEAGETPTPFERRPRAVEEEACARYFERVTVNNNNVLGTGLVTSSSGAQITLHYRAKRRQTSPVASSSTGFHVRHGASSEEITTGVIFDSIDHPPFDRAIMAATVAGGLTTGNACQFRGEGDDQYVDLDAEL